MYDGEEGLVTLGELVLRGQSSWVRQGSGWWQERGSCLFARKPNGVMSAGSTQALSLERTCPVGGEEGNP